MQGLEVVIIGGGVAGLAAAAALSQRGAQVLLLEQADGFLEVGAGLQISPNGARVIDALGQDEALRHVALRSRAVVLRKAARGAEVVRLALPEDGPGFHLIHRADLIDVLRGALGTGPGSVETRLIAQVTQVSPDGPRPSVTLHSGETLSADLILGADGLHSVTRQALDQGASARPFFTGQVAWRALIPSSPDAPPEAQVFMGPGRHLVSYPLRGGLRRNLVAVEERSAWAQEGWAHPGQAEDLRAAFAGFGGPVPGWLEQVDKVWLWGLFRHPVAQHWHRGQVALLGDAAHPTLPFMAQGANLALEDAMTLARVLSRGCSIPEALASYQKLRRDRVARVVEAANANARNYHLRRPLSDVAHLVLSAMGKLRPDAALARYRWIYEHDATSV
ncbi:MAG: FAD-dependent oxidoreductase [Roseinatronobacter sp.]